MIFEKIRERLLEQLKEYEESAKSQISIDYRQMDEMGMQATEEAFEIVNQVEAEYTCENCVEKGKCSIYDNADIKYCSDCRPYAAVAENATPTEWQNRIMNHFMKGE